MINETVRKLHEMKLGSMANAYVEQVEQPDIYADMDFDQRFALIADKCHDDWQNRTINGRIKRSGLPLRDVSFNDILFLPERNLKMEPVKLLCSNEYILKKRNIILLGATGTGKTFLANVFGLGACRSGYRVKYLRMPVFYSEYAAAAAKAKLDIYLKNLLNTPLLILDDFLLYPASDDQQQAIMELAESRYGRCSTIFCSQFDIAGWHDQLGGSALADSILDRISSNAHMIMLQGESMRKRNTAD